MEKKAKSLNPQLDSKTSGDLADKEMFQSNIKNSLNSYGVVKEK